MHDASPDHDASRDFDFETGHWRVEHRRLRQRLAGCRDWDRFDARVHAVPLPGGVGNHEVMHSEHLPGYVGMAFRLYDRVERRWAIHWVDNQRGVMDPPVYGRFVDGVGRFDGEDVLDGRPIRVRFLWLDTHGDTPRWEQAFSDDDGVTWETNWTMRFHRIDADVSDEVTPTTGRSAQSASGSTSV